MTSPPSSLTYITPRPCVQGCCASVGRALNKVDEWIWKVDAMILSLGTYAYTLLGFAVIAALAGWVFIGRERAY